MKEKEDIKKDIWKIERDRGEEREIDIKEARKIRTGRKKKGNILVVKLRLEENYGKKVKEQRVGLKRKLRRLSNPILPKESAQTLPMMQPKTWFTTPPPEIPCTCAT